MVIQVITSFTQKLIFLWSVITEEWNLSLCAAHMSARIYTYVYEYINIIGLYSPCVRGLRPRISYHFVMAVLFTLRVFTGKLLRESRRRKIFLFSFWWRYLIWGLNRELILPTRLWLLYNVYMYIYPLIPLINLISL